MAAFFADVGAPRSPESSRESTALYHRGMTLDLSDEEVAMDRVAVIVTCLAMLLAGCGGSLRGNASAGPNPGGGFYSPSNIDNGRVNP